MVDTARRGSWARPMRRSCLAMMAMFASVVIRGWVPVCTAYCSAGQAEGVVAEGVEHVAARHAVVAGEDVGADVAERVADVEAGP